ncbi:unnamed protein product, partial [Mesorhabditis belari]|uniref:Uncharacterized protein n=1 Tax=Mesorhabditis belari TaxID=2138241 RepID=A0AAF3F5J4_9BILA
MYCFPELRKLKLKDSHYTKDEVKREIDELQNLINTELEADLLYLGHLNFLLLRQFFFQAQKENVKLFANFSEIENRSLLDAVADFEKGISGKSSLLNDFSGLKISSGDLENSELREENEKLKRIAQSVDWDTGTREELEKELSSRERTLKEIYEASEREMGKRKKIEVEHENLSRRLEEITKELSMKESELEKKFMNTNTYLNMQKMIKLSYLKPLDYLWIFIGGVSAFIHGAGFPLLSVVLGSMTNIFLRAQNSPWIEGEHVITNDTKSITKEDFKHEILMISLYYAVLGLVQFITSYLQIACFETICENVVHRMRLRYLRAVLRQEIAWFDEKQTGNLTSRLTDDLERVREAFGDKFSMLIQNILAFVASFIIGFCYNWKMTLIMMAFVPPIVLVGAWCARFQANRAQIEQERYGIAGAIAEQALSSMRTIQALNAQKKELDKFNACLDEARKASIPRSFAIGAMIAFMHFCRYSSYAVAFWYAGKIIAEDTVADRGVVFTVFFAVMSGSTALSTALPFITVVSSGLGALRKVVEVIARIPPIDPYSNEGVKKNDLRGNIRFEDVKFRYPSRPEIQILNGVSLEVKAGQKIALVGASGCGKSTIVNLLLRFYDPMEGTVSIDGVDLRTINVKCLRDQIGIVSQEPVLFDGSLIENIRMGRDGVKDEEVVEACKMANAWGFIEMLPDRLNTRVGERGVQLSGGQKQRVAIARALVKNPQILLLDEATSALDTESEAVVQKALEQAQHGRTVIIVAHRLATIREADQIFVFKQGNIIEKGTNEELIAKKGVFHQMVQAQLLRQLEEKVNKTDDEKGNGKGMVLRKRSRTRSLSRSDSMRTSIRSMSRSQFGADATIEETTIEDLARAEDETNDANLKPISMLKIFTFNKKAIPKIIIGYTAGALVGFCTPIFAILYAQIFSVFSESTDKIVDSVHFWALMFIGLGLMHAVGAFFSNSMCGLAGEDCTKGLRSITFQSLMAKDIGFFDDEKNGTGKLCTRLATDAPNVRYVFTRMPLVTSSTVTVIASLTLAFIFGWKLALCVIPMLPIIVVAQGIEMRMQLGNKLRDARQLEEAGKVALQAIDNVRTVQALNKQEHFNALYCQHLNQPHKANVKGAQLYGIVFGIAQAIIFFMYAFAFFLGALFVMDGSMQPVQVYRVFFSLAFCGQMVGAIATFMPDIVKTRLAAALIFNLVNHPTKINNLSEKGLQKKLTGSISLNKLHFNYPTRAQIQVLDGFSLEIKAGQTVAFVGHSGCGKSTVLGLLERFYDPEKGEITLDNIPVNKFSLSSLRSQVGIVSQEPTLFDFTIRENIIYGMDNVPTEEEIVRATKLANAYDFITALPAAFETRVGERGTQLSGGQKQRIAIARALVREPAILLLDEATSALDTESEKVVQEALEKARQGRTCLVIAHRLSTVQDADAIAVIDQGRVADVGTHEELLQRNPIYQKLCATQKLVESRKE